MQRQRVIFVGDATYHEFHDAISWLREYCALTVVDSPRAAASRVAAAGPPNAMVLAQARPGVFSQSQIEALHRLAPLSRLIGLHGSWCEGELRTGAPWRGVVRVYWHQFVPRLANELSDRRGPALLAQPRTATDAEQFLATAALPEVQRRGLVVIKTPSQEAYSALADACTGLGHATVWSAPRQPTFATAAELGIWDCRTALQSDCQPLAEFVAQLHPAPVIALLGFPRCSDHDTASRCGVRAVVSKPYLVHDLWSEMSRVVMRQQATRPKLSAA